MGSSSPLTYDDLKPGDVIQVYVCDGEIGWEWERREVVARDGAVIRFSDHGREYDIDTSVERRRKVMMRRVLPPVPAKSFDAAWRESGRATSENGPTSTSPRNRLHSGSGSGSKFISRLTGATAVLARYLLAGVSTLVSLLGSLRRTRSPEPFARNGSGVGHSEKERTVPRELDVIRLDVAVGRWPAGTEGTLIDAYESGGVVEITDDEGRTLELVNVDYADVTVVWSLTEDPVAS